MSPAAEKQDAKTFGTEALPLRLPVCPRGTGDLITSVDSPKLIHGVRCESVPVWPDDRGWFAEIARMGSGLSRAFDPATTQVSAALSYSGCIKAFHYHLRQTDCWQPLSGMFQVILADLRLNSSTFGARNTIFAGTHRPWRILIPPGVAHGYKIVGADPGLLVYLTDRFYNPEDEGRIEYNCPELNYDWDTQHK